MSEFEPAEEPADDLQFTTAELGITPSPGTTAPARNCALCRQPIASIYYAVRDKLLCPACCERVNAPPPGTKFGRFLKALFLGLAAGLVGAVIWYVVRRVSGYEVGLIAVVVGFMVGKAVRKGSGNRGGRGYQIMAVVLTYCCIVTNYMPDILEGLFKSAEKHRTAAAAKDAPGAKANVAPAGDDRADDPAKNPRPHVSLLKGLLALVFVLALTFVFALAAPFLLAAQNPIGLLIIGFALWEAWKFTARRPIPISGPYQMAPAPSA